jgi:hypothetical protein
MQTKQVLIVAEAAGHDPLLATGLVLASLPSVCKKISEKSGGIYRLRAPRIARQDEWEALALVANHRNQSRKSLYEEHKLSEIELATDPLALRKS